VVPGLEPGAAAAAAVAAGGGGEAARSRCSVAAASWLAARAPAWPATASSAAACGCLAQGGMRGGQGLVCCGSRRRAGGCDMSHVPRPPPPLLKPPLPRLSTAPATPTCAASSADAPPSATPQVGDSARAAAAASRRCSGLPNLSPCWLRTGLPWGLLARRLGLGAGLLWGLPATRPAAAGLPGACEGKGTGVLAVAAGRLELAAAVTTPTLLSMPCPGSPGGTLGL
jgi:hypothetical protein